MDVSWHGTWIDEESFLKFIRSREKRERVAIELCSQASIALEEDIYLITHDLVDAPYPLQTLSKGHENHMATFVKDLAGSRLSETQTRWSDCSPLNPQSLLCQRLRLDNRVYFLLTGVRNSCTAAERAGIRDLVAALSPLQVLSQSHEERTGNAVCAAVQRHSKGTVSSSRRVLLVSARRTLCPTLLFHFNGKPASL